MNTENYSNPSDAEVRRGVAYYPLFLDIAALKAKVEPGPQPELGKSEPLPFEMVKPAPEQDFSQKVYNAEELMQLAIQHDCSEFQTVVLLLKNAFEGHIYLAFGIPSRILFEQGTMRVDPANDSHCEFSLHFIDHFDSYKDGFKRIWLQLQERFLHLKEICFDSLLFFLLSSQLYKLPVSALSAIDISRFMKLSEKQKRFFKYYFEISMIAQRAIADLMLVDHVNELYKERFRECVLKLSAKENLLFQLETKLIYAHDPMIRTEEQLEKKYFSFLITHEIHKDSGNLRLKYTAWDNDNGSGENPSGLKTYIRHLFRAISKNCREAFSISDDTAHTVDSTRFFMDSNSIYNELTFDFNDQFIQFNRLINLFVEVYNARIIHELPATFFDYTGIEQDKMLIKQLNEELIAKLKIHAVEKISELRDRCQTAFKGKHVDDKELAEIHEEYLKMQIHFLDQRIADILTEIKISMKEKTSEPVIR